MSTSRQDAWTDDEDMILAEIVLRHIRKGETQLEAFKQAAKSLSRTSAACGFRWNATIRKHHLEAIERAKYKRKHKLLEMNSVQDINEKETIDSVISMLEKVRYQEMQQQSSVDQKQEKKLQKLEEENQTLHKKIRRYEEAWEEMGKLWAWIDNSGAVAQKGNEH